MTSARASAKETNYRCNSSGLFSKIYTNSKLIVSFTEEYRQNQHILHVNSVDTLESLLNVAAVLLLLLILF